MAQDTDEVIFRMTISTVFCLANLLLSKRGYTQTVLDDLRKSLFLFYVLQLDSGARKLCHDVEIFFTPDYIKALSDDNLFGYHPRYRRNTETLLSAWLY